MPFEARFSKQIRGHTYGTAYLASAPTPAPSPARPRISERKTFAADAFFDFDRSELKPEGKAKLDNLVASIAGNPFEVIVVVSHADSSGTLAYNQALSERRSNAVKDYLVSKGIEKNRVYTESKGSTQPIASNSTAEGRAKNRRAEIEMVGTRSANGHGTSRSPRCAASELAQFPWPTPPQWSVSALVPPYELSGPDGNASTLLALAGRLENAIQRAGFRQPRYLGAGCDGFAIVLDLESIEADGTRKGGAEGFAPPSQDASISLAEWIKRLFYAPPGHYRQIVFVVSDQRIGGVTPLPTEAKLREIARDGVSALPTGFALVPYTPKHVVLALIYEFEKGVKNGDAKWIPPEGRLGATFHLIKAQLLKQ